MQQEVAGAVLPGLQLDFNAHFKGSIKIQVARGSMFRHDFGERFKQRLRLWSVWQ